jgi:hypothetical protein
MPNGDHTVGIEQVSQETLEAICKYNDSGLSLEAISRLIGLNITTVQQILTSDPMHRQRPVLLAPPLHTLPTFFYSYKHTDLLHRTSLVTGEHSSHRLPSYTFKWDFCWSELPRGSLLITGGGHPPVREVVRIDTRREFAVSECPPMLTPRKEHTAVYHTPHLYILGGYNIGYVSECERYVCAASHWEALPPLPRACRSMSGVVVERSLYALGGCDTSMLDLVQRLSLESLTWELMQLRLPYAGLAIPCFKLSDTEVYLVINKTLCSFTGLQVRPIKTLSEHIQSWSGACCYYRGTLYCLDYHGALCCHELWS